MTARAYLVGEVNRAVLGLAIEHVPVIEAFIPGVVLASSPVRSKYARRDQSISQRYGAWG